jgi:hypothetical protein
MFEDILDGNAPKIFGHLTRHSNKRHLGTLMKLVHAERVDDARLVLVAVGLSRLQVNQIIHEHPHMVRFWSHCILS